jgi:hypothetical protein
MKQRCYNLDCEQYKNYGGRGIKVCDRWLHSFDAFISDMGWKPTGMTLERERVNEDYSKNNCIWDSPKSQARNRRNTVMVEYKGTSRPLAEWAELLNVNYHTVQTRIHRDGKSLHQALGLSS